jgi:hypothetical protein
MGLKHFSRPQLSDFFDMEAFRAGEDPGEKSIP